MYHLARSFVLVIPLVGIAASLLVRVDDTVSSKKYNIGPSEHVHQEENDGGARTSLGETTREGAGKSLHSAETAPIKSILGGRPGYIAAGGSYDDDTAIPIEEVLKGRPRIVVVGGSPEYVNDRVDGVEAKVESVADELHKFETLAGLYVFFRIFGGLIFNSLVL